MTPKIFNLSDKITIRIENYGGDLSNWLYVHFESSPSGRVAEALKQNMSGFVNFSGNTLTVVSNSLIDDTKINLVKQALHLSGYDIFPEAFNWSTEDEILQLFDSYKAWTQEGLDVNGKTNIPIVVNDRQLDSVIRQGLYQARSKNKEYIGYFQYHDYLWEVSFTWHSKEQVFEGHIHADNKLVHKFIEFPKTKEIVKIICEK